MPVDLSRVGLEGIESFHRQMNTQAQTRKLDSSTQAEEFKVEQDKKMQALSERASKYLNDVAHRTNSGEPPEFGGELDSLADPLETVADIYMRGGAVEQGAEFLGKASEIRKREADMRSGEITDAQNKLENILKGSDIVGRKLGGAANESEWTQGLKEVRDAGVIEPELMDQLDAIPYDPDVATYFREQAISAAQKATLDMAAQNFEQRVKSDEIRFSQTARRIKLQEARDRVDAQHKAYLQKNEGNKSSGASAPSATELKSAETALSIGPFKDVDPNDELSKKDFDAAASYVASRAKQLVKGNKALDWDTALQQAIMSAEHSGAFSVEPGHSGFFGIGKKPADANFDRKGLDPTTAIPMPRKRSEMVRGRYYVTAKGKARWNGKEFELAE